MDRIYMASPVGTLCLCATERGLAEVHIVEAGEGLKEERSSPLLERAREQLKGYFEGRLRAFDLPFALEGTEFQRLVWAALCEIPYGETASYGEIARRIGRPRAVRAVGGANHNNPLAIVVPCHRVIGSDGRLVGYGGGLDVKQWLLDHERRHALPL